MIKNDDKKIVEEIKRHQDFLYEKFQGDVQIIAEQYSSIQGKLDSHSKILDFHTEMIGSIKEDIEIMKIDIAFIKNGLKEKVDRDEFVALEKRVILLEAKYGK